MKNQRQFTEVSIVSLPKLTPDEQAEAARLNYTAVYVVAPFSKGPCKIGYTKNILPRLSAMSCGSPIKLNLFGIYWFTHLDRAKQVEGGTHALLQDQRAHGEWFDVDVLKANAAIYTVAKRWHDEWINMAGWVKEAKTASAKRDDLYMAWKENLGS